MVKLEKTKLMEKREKERLTQKRAPKRNPKNENRMQHQCVVLVEVAMEGLLQEEA